MRPSRQPPEPYRAELAFAANAYRYESDREIQRCTWDDERQIVVIDTIHSDIDNEVRTISRKGRNLGREEMVTDFHNHAFPVFSDSNSWDSGPGNRFGQSRESHNFTLVRQWRYGCGRIVNGCAS